MTKKQELCWPFEPKLFVLAKVQFWLFSFCLLGGSCGICHAPRYDNINNATILIVKQLQTLS